MITRLKRRIKVLLSVFSPARHKKVEERIAQNKTTKPKSADFDHKKAYAPIRKQRKPQNQPMNVQEKNVHAKAPKKIEKKGSLKMPELLEVPPKEGKSRFIDFPIAKEVLCGIQDLEFKYCTAIQAKALPVTLEGKDITGKAQTGTGKTAAFLISIFTKFINNPRPDMKPGACRSLILAPTRELAIQIHKDAEALAKYCNLNINVVFGGMGYKEQRTRLASHRTDLLVGTPGRIIDYAKSKDLNLSQCEILVIDEADRMLDMGFIPDVKRIINQLPPTGQRQTMLFSATFTPAILKLAAQWLSLPVTLETEAEHVITELITQKFYSVSDREKLPLLLWIINNSGMKRMLVFGNRKDKNERLALKLERYGLKCELLSGDVPQNKRIKVVERFRSGETPIVVASDVAARGIHIDSITHVINYDLPQKPEDYIHRIGRTGRAGEKGEAISFVCEMGAYVLSDIEKLIGFKAKCLNPDDNMLRLPELPPGPPPSKLTREYNSGFKRSRAQFDRSRDRRRR